MTGGWARWCATAAGPASCCWASPPAPASPMATGRPSPPASGSACAAASRSASGTSRASARRPAAARRTWEPPSSAAASRSQAVSPKRRAGRAGSSAATPASATATCPAVLPGRAGPAGAVATGPVLREDSSLGSASLHLMCPWLCSSRELCLSRGCHLTGAETFWTHSCRAGSPQDAPGAGDALEAAAAGICVCFLQLALGTVVSPSICLAACLGRLRPSFRGEAAPVPVAKYPSFGAAGCDFSCQVIAGPELRAGAAL